jgi:hypothetical protein
MLPRTIVWEDGLKYDIDRVIDIRLPMQQRQVDKATVIPFRFNGAQTYLYLNAPPIRSTRKSGAGLLSAKSFEGIFMRTDEKSTNAG